MGDGDTVDPPDGLNKCPYRMLEMCNTYCGKDPNSCDDFLRAATLGHNSVGQNEGPGMGEHHRIYINSPLETLPSHLVGC